MISVAGTTGHDPATVSASDISVSVEARSRPATLSIRYTITVRRLDHRGRRPVRS